MAIFRMNCYSFVKQLNWKLFLGRTYLSFLFAFLSISYLPMIFGPILKKNSFGVYEICSAEITIVNLVTLGNLYFSTTNSERRVTYLFNSNTKTRLLL